MNPLIKSVEKYVPVFLKKNLDSNFVFHNLNHTYEVVQAALEIGQGSDLATSEMDILIVAAWFHDCGYVNAYIGHEEESKKIAKSYLEKWGANTDFILSVLACIEATKYPQHPGTMVEKVLCDADFFHFTKPSYPQYAKTIRKEFEVFLDKIYSDEEWLKVNTSLLMAHNYCTEYGKSVLRRFKNVNIELVNKKKIKMKDENTNNISDDVFKKKVDTSFDFAFDKKVALVFDDMVSRSVPFYGEMQRMVSELAKNHVQPKTKVYDIGCSTGTTLIQISKLVPENVSLVGIDDSEEMIVKCREKLNSLSLNREIELNMVDITKNVPVQDASVVTMVLVLQFVRPINRLEIVKKIYDGLTENGVFIIVEKILTEEASFNREYINYYYDFKRRNEYSELEISQKREALENVLIPYKTSENINMLRNGGFKQAEVFFRWYNFTGIIAKK